MSQKLQMIEVGCTCTLTHWFIKSMSYPTYFTDECLEKFTYLDDEEDRFKCNKCGSIYGLSYRFSQGFENKGKIYIPYDTSKIDIVTLSKKGISCFVLSRISCSFGCKSIWKLDELNLFDICMQDLDDEYVDKHKTIDIVKKNEPIHTKPKLRVIKWNILQLAVL